MGVRYVDVLDAIVRTRIDDNHVRFIGVIAGYCGVDLSNDVTRSGFNILDFGEYTLFVTFLERRLYVICHFTIGQTANHIDIEALPPQLVSQRPTEAITLVSAFTLVPNFILWPSHTHCR